MVVARAPAPENYLHPAPRTRLLLFRWPDIKYAFLVFLGTAKGADVRALAPRNGVTPTELEEAKRFAKTGDLAHAPSLSRDARMRAALVLARAASPSPAEIDAGVVAACREGGLSAPAVVEVVTWIAVLQMLHRLSSYFTVE